jgi:hypothetical protein
LSCTLHPACAAKAYSFAQLLMVSVLLLLLAYGSLQAPPG